MRQSSSTGLNSSYSQKHKTLRAISLQAKNTNSALMVSISPEYISAGGNRHPAAADWDTATGVLAYGTDINVALWDPAVSSDST